jgi:hypothetical protein
MAENTTIEVKERPILFSAPMVRAILERRKTQTRRIAKHPLAVAAKRIHSYKNQSEFDCVLGDDAGGIIYCPHGKPGDRLWVRETWARTTIAQSAPLAETFVYRECDTRTDYGGPWKPSIFMPRAACRITLAITSIKIERLHDISESDAIAEGCKGGHGSIPGYEYSATPLEHFQHTWNTINGAGAWSANPWVWVVEFKRIEVPA